MIIPKWYREHRQQQVTIRRNIAAYYYLHQGGSVTAMSVCFQNSSKSYEKILMKFSGNVASGPSNRCLAEACVL